MEAISHMQVLSGSHSRRQRAIALQAARTWACELRSDSESRGQRQICLRRVARVRFRGAEKMFHNGGGAGDLWIASDCLSKLLALRAVGTERSLHHPRESNTSRNSEEDFLTTARPTQRAEYLRRFRAIICPTNQSPVDRLRGRFQVATNA